MTMKDYQENVFTKLEKFMLIIKKELGDLSKEDLKKNIQRLANWQYKSKQEKKKIKLSKDSVIIYEIMLKHKFSPSTVYRWFLLEESPTEIKEQLGAQTISLRTASTLKKTKKGQLAVNEKQLRDMILFEIDRYIEV